MDYKKKYLKYKLKYENFKGGADAVEEQGLLASMWNSITGQLQTPPESTSPESIPDLEEQEFQVLQIGESEGIYKSKFKYGSDDIIINLECCGDYPTLFPERVRGCEGKAEHFVLGAAASIKTLDSSFDAIVKIVNNSDRNPNLKLETKKMEVINKINYMSDHNAIMIKLQNPDTRFNFNLLSFNMEGLCDRDYYPGEFSKRLELLEVHVNRFVTPGFIMVCQELVLQKYIERLEETGQIIKELLNDYLESKTGSRPIHFMSDGFTGGIFYDDSIWNLNTLVEIHRFNPQKTEDKKSNFYLFNHRAIENLNIGIVNIHLKAPTPEAYFKLVERQRHELQNILKKVDTINKGFNVPVYLCGDYNNRTNKAEQIFNSTRASLVNMTTGQKYIDQNISIFLNK